MEIYSVCIHAFTRARIEVTHEHRCCGDNLGWGCRVGHVRGGGGGGGEEERARGGC